jgi:hypothetical protein
VISRKVIVINSLETILLIENIIIKKARFYLDFYVNNEKSLFFQNSA